MKAGAREHDSNIAESKASGDTGRLNVYRITRVTRHCRKRGRGGGAERLLQRLGRPLQPLPVARLHVPRKL